MTIYDKGLIRAMKKAYRDGGYDVAVTENGVLIQSDGWGVEITAEAVPNSVKSLIVLHNGSLPRMDSAVHVCKEECADAILDIVASTMEDLAKGYAVTGGSRIKPTRLTMDGCRVWQTTDKLSVRLVDIEDQQILAGMCLEGILISGAIYGRSWFGSMYVRTQVVPVEDAPLIEHLAQMQWIPVEME